MENIFKHPNLTIFKQHGFVPAGICSDRKNVSGTCIFCGSVSSKSHSPKKTFFVNAESKKWDCKMCGKEGGYQTFLQEVYLFGKENIDYNRYDLLSSDRGISIKTLNQFNVGYNPLVDKFYVPTLIEDSVLNITLYDYKAHDKKYKFISSAGGRKGLYYRKGAESKKIIFLTEGQWDTMVVDEILRILKFDGNMAAVGIPGATQLNMQMIDIFKGKEVIVLLDNDYDREVDNRVVPGAGKKGSLKIFKLLKKQVKSLKFLHWKEGLNNGYDIRDLYNDEDHNCQKVMDYINQNVNELPQGFDEGDFEVSNNTEVPVVTLSGEGCSIDEVHGVFNRHLLLENLNSLDIVLATVVANRLPGSPVWLFLVGASGSGKSEILMSLNSTPEVEAVSSLTPHVLISGFSTDDKKDPSLIARLNNRCLCIKDFTTIMGMNITSQQEIVSTLRDCFDGNCAKPFGNGKDEKYESKFGLIAGVTPIIDFFSENLSALGERFIRHLVHIDKSIKGERNVLMKIMESISSGSKSSMQTELREVVLKFLDHRFDFNFHPSQERREQIIALAQWTSLLRGSVIRDNRTGEILLKPIVEYSTRLTEQLYKLYIALHLIYRKAEDCDEFYDRLKEVSISTVHRNNLEILKFLYESNDRVNLQGITEAIGLPSPTVKRHVENLTILQVLSKVKLEKMDGFGSSLMYTSSKKIQNLIRKSNIM